VQDTVSSASSWIQESSGVLKWTGSPDDCERFAEDPELDYPPPRGGGMTFADLQAGDAVFVILALDAKGLTTRDIQDVVQELDGVEVSPTLLSAIIADRIRLK
jgi:hypothetical protein